MRRDVIARLRCPYTGSAFEVKSVARECGSTIEFGVLRSDAGDFPIVAGVLRLLSDRLQAPIVDLVQQGRQEAALQAALEMPLQNWWGTLVNRAAQMAERWNLGTIAR